MTSERVSDIALTKLLHYGERTSDGRNTGTLFRFKDGHSFFLADPDIDALRRSGGVAVKGLTVSTAIKDALRELDNVTAISDQDANCLGCAENLLRRALDALSTPSPAPEGEPVGEAGAMPGSNGGFTMAVFEAIKVQIGAKLYASPPEPVEVVGELLSALKSARTIIREDRDEMFASVTVGGNPSTMAEIDRAGIDRLDDVLREIDAALKREGE